jgi:hypothetical protein
MSADQEEYDAERASLIESFHYTLGKEALAIGKLNLTLISSSNAYRGRV